MRVQDQFAGVDASVSAEFIGEVVNTLTSASIKAPAHWCFPRVCWQRDVDYDLIRLGLLTRDQIPMPPR
jgi:hypothetical protein